MSSPFTRIRFAVLAVGFLTGGCSIVTGPSRTDFQEAGKAYGEALRAAVD